jgi:hypothetical protein
MYVAGSMSRGLNKDILGLFINKPVTYHEELSRMHEHFHVFFVRSV